MLPSETWLEVLNFVTKRALVDRVSVSPLHAVAYTRLHEDGPKRALPFLMFCRQNGSNDDESEDSAQLKKAQTVRNSSSGRAVRSWTNLPIADCEPSKNIASFSRIEINFFNQQVLHFLHMIHQRLLVDVHLEVDGVERFGPEGYRMCSGTLDVLDQLQPLLLGRVATLQLRSEFFTPFLVRFPTLCQAVRLIELDLLSEALLPPLVQWLCTPRAAGTDHRPKMVVIVESQDNIAIRDQFIEQIKEHFLYGTISSASFFIRLCSEFPIDANRSVEQLVMSDDEEEDEEDEEEGSDDEEEEEEDEEVNKYFGKYQKKHEENDEEDGSEDEGDDEADQTDDESDADEFPKWKSSGHQPFSLTKVNTGERMELRRRNQLELVLSRWSNNENELEESGSEKWRAEQERALCEWQLYGYSQRPRTLFIGSIPSTHKSDLSDDEDGEPAAKRSKKTLLDDE